MTLPPGWTRTDHGSGSRAWTLFDGPRFRVTLRRDCVRLIDRESGAAISIESAGELVQVLEHARALHGELFPEATP